MNIITALLFDHKSMSDYVHGISCAVTMFGQRRRRSRPVYDSVFNHSKAARELTFECLRLCDLSLLATSLLNNRNNQSWSCIFPPVCYLLDSRWGDGKRSAGISARKGNEPQIRFYKINVISSLCRRFIGMIFSRTVVKVFYGNVINISVMVDGRSWLTLLLK